MKHTTQAIAIVASLFEAVVAAGCNDSTGPSSITVTVVSPASGPLAGGTSVTITGDNFVTVTSVTIGGNELGSQMVVSATEITGTTPASISPGAWDVVVTSSGHGSGTCTRCFTYVSSGVLASPIAAGYQHTCGLSSSGAAYCWGSNLSGQLGTREQLRSSTPVAVAGGLSFSALGTGWDYTCGLTSAGAAYCWGSNVGGQLGDGSQTSSSTPVAVSGGLSFSGITTGDGHTCGITAAGAAYCWGYNGYGQLGNSLGGDSSVPVAVFRWP